MSSPMRRVSSLVSRDISNYITNQQAWGGIIINPSSFGAKGDGKTDDTGSLQSAINSVESGELRLPQGLVYKITSSLILQDKKDFKISGGGKILLTEANTTAFVFRGDCENIVIEGLEAEGDAFVSSRHIFCNSSSGQNLTNITIRNNVIKNIVLGISLNADLSGTLNGAVITGNHIENIVGVDPGQGYGIHVSYWDASKHAGVIIKDNTIVNAHRHSIYVARGKGYIVSGNIIKDHRKNASDQSNPRAAINISRSSDVLVEGNVLDECHTSIMITPGETVGSITYPAKNVLVQNNIINRGKGPISVSVGYLSPELYNGVEDINICGNSIVTDVNVAPLTLYYGKNVTVENNIIINPLGFGLVLQGQGESAGTRNYSDNWNVKNNVIKGLTNAIRLNPAYCASAIPCTFEGNTLAKSGNDFSGAAVVSNPNLAVAGHGISGLSLSSGVRLKPMVMGRISVGNGATGNFTTSDGKTVTIENGVIVSIVSG